MPVLGGCGEASQEWIHLPPQEGTYVHSAASPRFPPACCGEKIGSSTSRDAFGRYICLRASKEQLRHAISSSDPLTLLNLSTSSLSRTTKLSIFSICSHLTQLLSLSRSDASARLWHSLQPDTWTPACFHNSSVFIATSFLIHTDGFAPCRIGAILNSSLELMGGRPHCAAFPARVKCHAAPE